MRVSLKDVAELAQVSKTTASRAINNEDRIDEETKRRVLEAVKTLNYQPNRVARSLRSQRSHVIGVIFSNLFAGHFYSEIFRGIEENAFLQNYNLILGCSDGSFEKEQKIIESFMAQQVDGIILIPTQSFGMDTIKRLSQVRIPVVCIDRTTGLDMCDFVGTDNATGGRLAAEYLVRLGHQSVAVCLGLEGDVSSVRVRWEGMRRVFETNHVKYTILHSDMVQDSKKYAYEAVIRGQEQFRTEKVTAIAAMTDSLAFGCMKAVTETGYIPGKTMAIIGYNNDDICDYLSVPLTTIEQPKYQIGQIAIQMLLKRIEGDCAKIQNIELEPRLIVRKSCGE